jgi:hypothetical protein
MASGEYCSSVWIPYTVTTATTSATTTDVYITFTGTSSNCYYSFSYGGYGESGMADAKSFKEWGRGPGMVRAEVECGLLKLEM